MRIEFDAQMDIDIPAHLMPVVAALLTNKEERTNEQWYLLELFSEDEKYYEAIINKIMKEEEDFYSDMCRPIARTYYDDCEVKEIEEEEE